MITRVTFTLMAALLAATTTNAQCSVCEPGYELNSGACTATACSIDSCVTCESSTKCSVCSAGFRPCPVTGVCAPCIDNCDVCTTNATTCDDCSEGFRPCPVTGVCTPCIDNCNDCTTDATTCDVCLAGFRPCPVTGVCTPCIDNCDVCTTDATKCDACWAGFRKCPISGVCIACSDTGCKTCSDSSTCDVCKDGYELTGDNCELTSGLCAALVTPDSNCQTCEFSDASNATMCKTCGTGYRLCPVTNKCLACVEKCDQCSDATTCDACASDYDFDNNSGICKAKCDIPGCIGGCSGNTNLCTECGPGYGLCPVTSKCVACTTNCTTCGDGYAPCNQCDDGFVLTSDALCVSENTPQSSSGGSGPFPALEVGMGVTAGVVALAILVGAGIYFRGTRLARFGGKRVLSARELHVRMEKKASANSFAPLMIEMS